MNKQDASAQFYTGYLGELYQHIALGRILEHRKFLAVGNNPSISPGIPEDIWAGGGIYPVNNSPVSIEVVSSSVEDSAAGTGARTIAAMCLDSNYNEITQVVTMNGTTVVAFPTPVVAVNLAVVFTAGSALTNVGDISVRVNGAGLLRSVLPAGIGQTRKAVYTVPAGYTLNMNQVVSSMNRTTGTATNYATIGLGVRSLSGVQRIPFEYGISSAGVAVFRVDPGAIIQEKETVFARCMDVSVNNSNLTVALSGILSKN